MKDKEKSSFFGSLNRLLESLLVRSVGRVQGLAPRKCLGQNRAVLLSQTFSEGQRRNSALRLREGQQLVGRILEPSMTWSEDPAQHPPASGSGLALSA